MNTTLRKIGVPALALSVLMFAGGCVSLDKQYAREVKNAADLILPDYVQYVENDPNLDEDSKGVRKDMVDELNRLLEEGADGA